MSLADNISRRFWLLDSARLSADARARAGLTDFGEPPLDPPLSVLAKSLETEADLHPLGRFLMRFHLHGLLQKRLQLANIWHDQSEALAASPIRRPIFITGMPRSGSTFLHELLAQDPLNRAPRVWEVMFPIPSSNVERGGRDLRVRQAEACLWCFRRLAPQADAVFPMRAWTPHECVAIHSYTFLSEEFISTCRVPTYEAFLRRADLRPAYAWQRRFLQHLQLQRPARQWILKSPDHVHGLDALFANFPDALIILTHRNPLEVLRSSCHLTEVLHKLYARPGKPELLGTRESKLLAQAVARFIQFRDAHPELNDRFIDVKYTELIADPLVVIQQIYQKFEIPLSDLAAQRMRRLAEGKSRYRGARARAALHELRLDSMAAVARFEEYCARFGIAWQKPGLR